MALVLTLRRGQDFFVGEVCFVVEEVLSPVRFRLHEEFPMGHVSPARPRSFEISDARATEILPDVLVSAGDNAPRASARIVIEAPQEVLILRGATKRKRAPQVLAPQ
jgi:hypothetical protein